MVRKARSGKLTAEDYQGTTISLTNPGGIGTMHSVPRLMAGQGAIIGVGAMEYPAEFQGACEQTLADLGISKIMTLTSTYDHRIIQGAESGEFLRRIHQLLLGEDEFYDDVFTSLRLPYEPVRWVQDLDVGRHGAVDKTARVLEIIDAYRTRGHLMADTDPLNYRQRRHPDLDVLSHGLTLWDLDREFPVGGFNGRDYMKLRDILGVLRDSYCRTVGIEYMHIMDPVQRRWIQHRVEVKHEKPPVEEQKYILGRLNAAEAFETFLQTKYIGQKRFSLEGGETVIALLDAALNKCRRVRPGRGRHRHGAPRPAQRAGQHRRQAVLADLPRVRGQHRPGPGARLRRREVPPGRRGQVHPAVRRRPGRRLAGAPTPPTWRSSTRCWRAWPGPSRTAEPRRRRASP